MRGLDSIEAWILSSLAGDTHVTVDPEDDLAKRAIVRLVERKCIDRTRSLDLGDMIAIDYEITPLGELAWRAHNATPPKFKLDT